LKVLYRTSFLRDLKKFKRQKAIYDAIFTIAFDTLPQADRLQDVPQVKALIGNPGRYRIRWGDYRIGLEVKGDAVELVRVLHRRDFYRYYP